MIEADTVHEIDSAEASDDAFRSLAMTVRNMLRQIPGIDRADVGFSDQYLIISVTGADFCRAYQATRSVLPPWCRLIFTCTDPAA